VESILASKHRGYLALANHFERLVRLDRLRHRAQDRERRRYHLTCRQACRRQSGAHLRFRNQLLFAERPELTGMSIRVASDVYDGSIKAGLAALERSF
jgi:hypothetical protein